MPEKSSLFRAVNQSLGQQPSLGPIPASLLAPSIVILISFYILFVLILRLQFVWFLLLSIWGMTSWWIVVGQRTWKFVHKFTIVPQWKRGHLPYQPCLREDKHDPHETSHRY